MFKARSFFYSSPKNYILSSVYKTILGTKALPRDLYNFLPSSMFRMNQTKQEGFEL